MRSRGLPPGGRKTSSGRITITIRTQVNGEFKRLSHSKVKPDEPSTYANEAEAWAGYERVKAYAETARTQSVTLNAFREEWTDPEHFLWGTIKGRSEPTIQAYKTRTSRFAAMYGDRPLDSFTEFDVHRYLKAGGKKSTLYTIATLFHDAMSQGLIDEHPCSKLAADAEAAIRRDRKSNREDPPTGEQIEEMLTRAKAPAFPSSLWAWLVVATETGMRGGELDGMQWEFLKGNRYRIRRQWHRGIGRMTGPKHGSTRDLLLSDKAMAAIQTCRDNGSTYIFVNRSRNHWAHDTRSRWWEWCGDGGPALRQLVGGATMYTSTRHRWASWAVNEAGLSPYQASLLYGHSDGGKLITDTYAKPDHERAMQAALEASRQASKISDLDEKRRAS